MDLVVEIPEEIALLRQELAWVFDSRFARGLVHPPEAVLSLSVLGLMCGQSSLTLKRPCPSAFTGSEWRCVSDDNILAAHGCPGGEEINPWSLGVDHGGDVSFAVKRSPVCVSVSSLDEGVLAGERVDGVPGSLGVGLVGLLYEAGAGVLGLKL